MQETVTIGQQNVAVDNTWLHDALIEFRKINGDRATSAQALARIVERLRALLERLDEMKEAANVTRDEDKARLAEILRRPEYNKQPAEGNAMERLVDKIARWLLSLLRSLFPKSRPFSPGSLRALSGIAQIVVIGAALALTVLTVGGVYLLLRGRLGLALTAVRDNEIGARSAQVCQLANIGYQLRRMLRWDPMREEFTDNAEANRLRSRENRAPWDRV